MSLKAKIEAIIYAAEEPVTLEQISAALRASLPAEQHDALLVDLPVAIEELMAANASPERGIEITRVAGGYRMATKPEHHDVVRAFVKDLKPPIRLSLPALETLAVIAYKQPVTGPEISEIRGVDTSGVLATLMDRKLITTAGRKAVVGRPILYKTTKEFLMRFGLSELNELPSVEEFEKLASDSLTQQGLFPDAALADATGTPSDDEPEAVVAEAAEGAESESLADAAAVHNSLN